NLVVLDRDVAIRLMGKAAILLTRESERGYRFELMGESKSFVQVTGFGKTPLISAQASVLLGTSAHDAVLEPSSVLPLTPLTRLSIPIGAASNWPFAPLIPPCCNYGEVLAYEPAVTTFDLWATSPAGQVEGPSLATVEIVI